MYETDDGDGSLRTPVIVAINMEKRVSHAVRFSIAGRRRRDDKLALQKLRSTESSCPNMIRTRRGTYLATVAERCQAPAARTAVGHDRDFLVFTAGDVDRSRSGALARAARPDRHGCFNKFMRRPVGELNTPAAVHDIDHPDIEAQAPVLVTDADASQVSSVIDVAADQPRDSRSARHGKVADHHQHYCQRDGRENRSCSYPRKWRLSGVKIGSTTWARPVLPRSSFAKASKMQVQRP